MASTQACKESVDASVSRRPGKGCWSSSNTGRATGDKSLRREVSRGCQASVQTGGLKHAVSMLRQLLKRGYPAQAGRLPVS